MLNAAIAIAQADMGTLQLCDAEGKRLEIVAQQGFSQSYVDYWNAAAEHEGGGGPASQRAEMISVEDVTKSPVFVNSPALEVQLKAGVRAVLSVPLVTPDGKTVGVLSTHYRSPYRADARKMRVFDLLAREIAGIIDQGLGIQAGSQQDPRA